MYLISFISVGSAKSFNDVNRDILLNSIQLTGNNNHSCFDYGCDIPVNLSDQLIKYN